MKDRIFKVMKWSGLNLSQFAEAIQVSPALLSSVKSERTKPTLLLIENIKRVYPEIDINWLITGEGEMQVGAPGGMMIAAETPAKLEEEPEPVAVKPANREAATVTVTARPVAETATEEPEPKGKCDVRVQLRAVKQVLLMYNDGTYESFEK